MCYIVLLLENDMNTDCMFFNQVVSLDSELVELLKQLN